MSSSGEPCMYARPRWFPGLHRCDSTKLSNRMSFRQRLCRLSPSRGWSVRGPGERMQRPRHKPLDICLRCPARHAILTRVSCCSVSPMAADYHSQRSDRGHDSLNARLDLPPVTSSVRKRAGKRGISQSSPQKKSVEQASGLRLQVHGSYCRGSRQGDPGRDGCVRAAPRELTYLTCPAPSRLPVASTPLRTSCRVILTEEKYSHPAYRLSV